MKRFSYEDYAEFRKMRGARVRKTEKAEIADLKSSIDQLIEQRDYDSLDALRKIAAALTGDPEDQTAEKAQYDLYYVTSQLPETNNSYRALLSAIVARR